MEEELGYFRGRRFRAIWSSDASRSFANQRFTPSIVTGSGNIPSATSSRNRVRPNPQCFAADTQSIAAAVATLERFTGGPAVLREPHKLPASTVATVQHAATKSDSEMSSCSRIRRASSSSIQESNAIPRVWFSCHVFDNLNDILAVNSSAFTEFESMFHTSFMVAHQYCLGPFATSRRRIRK
jgi:hypothetical protein